MLEMEIKMIDVHSHIVYGVDDGAATLEESLRMMGEASRAGIQVIVATPHFHKGVYESDRIVDIYQRLEIKAADYNLKLLPGYEVFLNPLDPDFAGKDSKLTINGTKYLLGEFPFNAVPSYVLEAIYKLQVNGITPIIAHPERNKCFIKDLGLLQDMVYRGCLVQIDAASLLGVYGVHAKRFSKKLIKSRMAHFVASDAHYPEDYADWYPKAHEKVRRWAGEEYAETVFNRNADMIFQSSKEYVPEVV